VTRKANLEHTGRNAITFNVDSEPDSISITDHDFLRYIRLSTFGITSGDSVLTCLNGNALRNKIWSEIKAVVDKVHKHVCGHASYTDFELLLARNGLWNDAVASYVAQCVDQCTACRSTAPPQPNRKVSISSLSKSFNDIVCIDHFYLDQIRLMHCMDLVSRYSAVHIVSTVTMGEAVQAFEACWVSQFWYPESVHGDKAFQVGDFKTYADSLGIKIRPVPPRGHNKNAIESKNRVIRGIFLRLKNAAGDSFDPNVATYKAVSISNSLYGNDTMSVFEPTKGFSKPIHSKPA